MLKALRRNAWIVVVDALGACLAVGLVAGAAEGGFFAAALFGLPIAFAAALVAGAGG